MFLYLFVCLSNCILEKEGYARMHTLICQLERYSLIVNSGLERGQLGNTLQCAIPRLYT